MAGLFDTTRRSLLIRLVAIGSGLLLMAGQLYGPLAPLGIAAFMGVAFIVLRLNANKLDLAVAGLYMGLAYILVQMYVLRLPVVMTAILMIYMVAMTTAMVMGIGILSRLSVVGGCLAAGAWAAFIDWINISAVDIWSAAQSFSRCWSSWPAMIQFSSVTGITGVTFTVVSLATIFAKVCFYPKQRTRLVIAAATMILVFAVINRVMWYAQPKASIKVAAVGWTNIDEDKFGSSDSREGFEYLFSVPAAQAAERGAKIVVTPELGFYLGDEDREKWLERFRKVAAENDIYLAVGYYNGVVHENRLFYMSPAGQVLGEFTKKHITAFEDFDEGDGKPVVIQADDLRIGGMICQDDNFTALTRDYGRLALDIAAVPTLDWYQVKDAHFQSSIHRAIESRYAIIRAARDGISAIVSAKGQVLARKDHFKDGPGYVIAEVAVYDTVTLYSICGDKLMVGLAAAYIAGFVGFSIAAGRYKKDVKAANVTIADQPKDDSAIKVDDRIISGI